MFFFKTLVLSFVFLIVSKKSMFGQSGLSSGSSSKLTIEEIKFPESNSNFSEVDFLSGNPQISLDVWDVKLNGFNLPIKMSYDVNSLKVDNISSWVGLGWYLNAGGSITRSLNDFPDDITAIRFAQNTVIPIKKYGYIKGGNTRLNAFNMNHTTDWENTYELKKTMGTIYQLDANHNVYTECTDDLTARNGAYDTEPDDFAINLFGSSQKFMFNGSNEIKFTPNSNYRISYTMDNSTERGHPALYNTTCTKGINLFEVLDEYGNKYIFDLPIRIKNWGANERWNIYYPGIENTMPVSPGQGGSFLYLATDEWKLSKIITKNGDEINFTYEEQIIKYADLNSKSKQDFTKSNFYYFYQERKEKRLIQIESKNEIIKFIATNSRLDLINSKRLDGVEVFSKNQGLTLIKKIRFDYSYFQSNTTETAINSMAPAAIQDDVYKRLKLLSLNEVGDNLTEKNISFSYNENYVLPRRQSSKKDFWGYFNDANTGGTGITELFPYLYVYPNLNTPDKFSVFNFDMDNSGTPFEYPAGNRAPRANADIVGASSLKKINFSTGGYRQFDFESNNFFYKNKNFVGGGLRLKQEILFDPLTAQQIVKKYDYTDLANSSNSSGKIINYPIFAFTENTAGFRYHSFYPLYNSNTYVYDVLPYSMINNINELYYRSFLAITNNPSWALGKLEKNNVEYKYIKEKIEVNGSSNGYNLYEFNAYDFKEIMNSNYSFAPINRPWEKNYHTRSYACAGGGPLNNCTVPNQVDYCGSAAWDMESDSYADIRGLEFGKGAVPIGPTTWYDMSRGQLKQKIVFDAFNIVKQKNVLEYDNLIPFSSDDVIKGLKIQHFENYRIGKAAYLYPIDQGNQNIWFNEFFVYVPYKYFTSNKSMLKKEESFYYSSPTSFLKTLKEFEYTAKGQLRSETFTGSDNICRKTIYKYPTDFSIQAPINNPNTLALVNMQIKNQINDIVEKTTYNSCVPNSNVLNSELNIFGLQTNSNSQKFINIKENYKLINTSPIAFSPLQVTGGVLGVFAKDNNYNLSNSLAYNTDNNIIEQKKYNNIINTQIWDYNSSYVVAEVTNASNDLVAYTSFEANGFGNWLGIVPANCVLDVNSLSGVKDYNLAGTTISKTGLLATNKYVVSYWSKQVALNINGTLTGWPKLLKTKTINGQIWNCYEHEIFGVNSITISGNSVIDELRFYPRNAQMKTFTYNVLVGLSSTTDYNNITTYYEYDGFKRLSLIKDQDKNILKKICYNYAGQVEECPLINNTTPRWVATGNTRCQPCALDPLYNSGVREKEERDINPNSAAPNAIRWVIDPSGTCPTPPNYIPRTDLAYCEQIMGVNTGNQITPTVDNASCSPTIGGWGPPIILANAPACAVCTVPCAAPQYKCINGVCTLGFWRVVKAVKISKLPLPTGTWQCVRAWCYPDGTMDDASAQTTSGPVPCAVDCF